jgi:hypothetical protein
VKCRERRGTVAKAGKAWESFEDAFRAILEAHKEFFGLDSVEPAPGTAKAASGYVYNIEVLGYTKGDERLVLFECRRKKRNVEPGEAGEFAYRILTTGANKGYFVTTLDKGLSEGAKMHADYEQIGHIQLSADATPHEYVMKYLNNFFVGVVGRLTLGGSASFEVRDSKGNLIAKG